MDAQFKSYTCMRLCVVEVRIYNPQLKKLNPRRTSGYFIGYAVNSKGYRSYYPSRCIRIITAKNVKFIENLSFSWSYIPRMIELEETWDSIELHKDKRLLIII